MSVDWYSDFEVLVVEFFAPLLAVRLVYVQTYLGLLGLGKREFRRWRCLELDRK